MKNKLLFIAIIILAAFLRLWSLNNYPAGLNADEASIGYNAYSLLQTGKDEYGTTFPLTFKSFGDYKPGLYFYFAMPFVATLGLNEWAIRLPSAFLGIGTVILILFLSKEIFKKEGIAILATLLLAISPWHLHFSRGGWETNAATFFITLGIWLFIRGLNNWIYLCWSLFAFLASMYIYQSPRLIVPVLIIILVGLYFRKLTSIVRLIKLKTKIITVILLIILSAPLVYQFVSGTGSARFSGLSFFSDSGPQNRVNELRGKHQNSNNLLVKILHNKLTSLGPLFLGHYLDHFDSSFLFIRGDPIIRNKVPEVGQFYLIEALFLIVGILALIRNKFENTKLLLAWILIAPLASATTYQTPHALRALSMVIPLTAVMAYGLWVMVDGLSKKWKIIGVWLVSIILLFEFIHYLESYYIHYPKKYPLSWEYGFKQMVEKLNKLESNYDKVIITDRYDQPYILVLFYKASLPSKDGKKYDPSKYQPQAHLSERDKFNFGTVRFFDKYQFRQFNPSDVKEASSATLYIGTLKEMPENVKILDRVDFPNNQPAFIFAEGQKNAK